MLSKRDTLGHLAGAVLVATAAIVIRWVSSRQQVVSSMESTPEPAATPIGELWVRKGYEEEAKGLFKKLKVEEITGILVEGTAGARLVLGR